MTDPDKTDQEESDCKNVIFQVELELESSLGRGDIGQASWLTLPAIILILTALFNWDKVSFFVQNFQLNALQGVPPGDKCCIKH